MTKKKKETKEEYTLRIIIKVCDKCKNKYIIDGMTSDDVFQESYLICADAIERFDGRTTLENFLSYNLCRRLINLCIRTNGKIIDTLPIDRVPENQLGFETPENTQEFISYINMKLDVDMRHDYLKYVHGVFIPRVRKNRLVKELKRIADDF